MKAIEPGLQGQAFTLGQVRLNFIVEFKLPQSEQQALSELQEIQQREGESSWEYSQKFKDSIGRLAHPIHEDHQREWYIQGLDPGFSSKSAPTSPNYWPFRQHLRSRCSLTRSSYRGLQDTGVYNQRKCKMDSKQLHTVT
jgi:hypothetical protein